LIRAYLHRQKPKLKVGSFPLQGLSGEQVWEAIHGQVFRATAGPFADESFLIRGDQVVPLGTAIGGHGLTSLVVSDLDEDGIAELLFTYSFGSGIHQSRIGVFAPAYDSRRTHEGGVSYHGDLGLYAHDRAGVGVGVVEVEQADLTLRYLTPLGDLVLEGHEGQVSLVLMVADDLPEDVQKNLFLVQED
jgi:hypothetical protein